MTYDYIIVGSGLFGATFAFRATRKGMRVMVLDKRNHTGGNIHCRKTEGINVHEYGAHIFHTSDRKVWEFVNSMVPFNRYTNCPVANYKGALYNLPFNMNTFHQMWGVTTPAEAQAIIEEQKAEAAAKMKREGAAEPRNLEEQAQVLIGKDIYEKLIKGYTEKQWGRSCTELPAFIIRRLPVRFVYDNNYFNDNWQGIPIGGYNLLTDKMLEGSEVRLGRDFFDLSAEINCTNWREFGRKLVFTGPIDQFFGFRFGKLEYRTVRFETEILDMPNYQGNAVVNYTEREVPWTRIIEHKHFEMFGADVYDCPKTVVSREYSAEFKEGMEPYYPVNDERNNNLAAMYASLAAEESDVIFGGRLAEYKYYDMAPVIAKVLEMEI